MSILYGSILGDKVNLADATAFLDEPAKALQYEDIAIRLALTDTQSHRSRRMAHFRRRTEVTGLG